MASDTFDDRFVRELTGPEKGNRIGYDRGKDAVKGFASRPPVRNRSCSITPSRVASGG